MTGGSVTVPAAGGSFITVPLNNDQALAEGRQIAATINAAQAAGTLTAINFPGPFIVGPATSEAVIPQDAAGDTYNGPVGFQYLVDAANVPVTINGALNQTVLAGTGGTTYFGPAYVGPAGGIQKIDVGGGTNLIALGAGSTNTVVTGDGSSTIYSSGNATINAGQGSLIFGSHLGETSVIEAANSTIIGGAGPTTIFGGGGNTEFLGPASIFRGGSLVVEGSGADTINLGTAAATIFGGSGTNLVFGNTQGGAVIFVAGTGPSTIVGGVAGANTLFGSAGSDVIYDSNRGGVLYVAGAGSETLDASGSKAGGAPFLPGYTRFGSDTLFAGTGAVSIVAGSANDTIVASTGALTASGGAGNDVFVLFKGHAGGADLIQNFSTSDLVLLSGYGASGIASSVTGGSSTTLTLSDNSTVTFSGVTNLNLNQIIKT